jgi:hypothetical protein
MRLKQGDRFRCSNTGCGLVVIVTDGGRVGDFASMPRCSCGIAMRKSYEKPVVCKTRLSCQGRSAEGIRHPGA